MLCAPARRRGPVKPQRGFLLPFWLFYLESELARASQREGLNVDIRRAPQQGPRAWRAHWRVGESTTQGKSLASGQRCSPDGQNRSRSTTRARLAFDWFRKPATAGGGQPPPIMFTRRPRCRSPATRSCNTTGPSQTPASTVAPWSIGPAGQAGPYAGSHMVSAAQACTSQKASKSIGWRAISARPAFVRQAHAPSSP